MKIGELDVSKIYLGSAEIEKIYLGTEQVYDGGSEPTPTPYDEQYLTIESTSNNNTIYWLNPRGDGINKTISVSTDNGTTWTEYESSDDPGTAIATLNTNDKLLLKGMEGTYEAKGVITSTSSFITYGNIMSLVYGDNFSGQTTIENNNQFRGLFSGCTSLTSAENLILPATTLTTSCYVEMFKGCTSLVNTPELPATTLAESCYQGMFYNCTNLTTAPVLSATSLANWCYSNMFQGCTSLTAAPELPATTLADFCYFRMFEGCDTLNYIKCLATNISASNCTTDWVNGVAFNGTFVKAASMNDWAYGGGGIPDGWTVKDDVDYSTRYLTIKTLEAGNLTVSGATSNVFYYSRDNGTTWNTLTSADTVSINANETVLLKADYRDMVVTNNKIGNIKYGGTFNLCGNIMSLAYGDDFINETRIVVPYYFASLFERSYVVSAENLVLPATTLSERCYAYMFTYSNSLTTAPSILPATTLVNDCYNNMFQGCTSLTTAPVLPATTLANGCYKSMFSTCTSLTTAPELPATTLAVASYNYMFKRCTNLNYVKCLATDVSADSCTLEWLDGVASSGTFVKAASMSGWSTGTSGIPNGWTVENDDGSQYIDDGGNDPLDPGDAE